MFSKAQFNGALRIIRSSDEKMKAAVTGAVSFVVFHYVAHSKNVTPRTQLLEATSGIRWLHAALEVELAMGSMPRLDKSFTEEAADTWAAFAVSRVWESQQAKRERAKAQRRDRKEKDTPPLNTAGTTAPQAPEAPKAPALPEGTHNVIEGEYVEVLDVAGPLLINTDGTTMELSDDEYKQCVALVMKLRMTALRAA